MRKVLVAEDDRGTRLIVSRILEKEGYEIFEARDGESACATAVSEKPDIVLLDVKMPVMDGFEVIKRLRNDPATQAIPVILMTVLPPEKGEPVATKLGVRHYLTKPLNPGMVKLAVRVALREAETETNGSRSNRTPIKKKDPAYPEEGPKVSEAREVIRIGNEMIDAKLGSGIPLGSLTLIEGAQSAGKSVLCQHFTYSSLLKGQPVAYLTFEDTAKSLASQMDSLGMDVSEHMAKDNLHVFPLEHPDESEKPETFLALLARRMERLPERYKTIFVDSITNLAASSQESVIMGFFTSCRRLCRGGKTIILVTHSYTFDEQMLIRLRALCDVHLRLCLDHFTNKVVKSLEVCKVHNAVLDNVNVIRFEVVPGAGMQVSPYRSVTV